jgi:hypothetical protein
MIKHPRFKMHFTPSPAMNRASRAETQLSWFPRTKMIPSETFPLQFLRLSN